MTATKTATVVSKSRRGPRGPQPPERVEQRRVTTAQNRALEIDWDDGVDPADLATTRRGMWERRMAELIAGVRDGKGKPDTFYRLGVSTNDQWARTTVTALNKRGLYAHEVALEARRLPDGGSEVRGCVVSNGDMALGGTVVYTDDDFHGEGDEDGYEGLEE